MQSKVTLTHYYAAKEKQELTFEFEADGQYIGKFKSVRMTGYWDMLQGDFSHAAKSVVDEAKNQGIVLRKSHVRKLMRRMVAHWLEGGTYKSLTYTVNI